MAPGAAEETPESSGFSSIVARYLWLRSPYSLTLEIAPSSSSRRNPWLAEPLLIAKRLMISSIASGVSDENKRP